MDNVLMEPLKKFVSKVAGFLPNLFISAILIIIGFFLAALLRAVVSRLTRFLKMDRLSEKVGLTQMLQKSGIKEPVSWRYHMSPYPPSTLLGWPWTPPTT